MERIGATASNTIFIDDSPRNIAAAHELGIFTVSCAEQQGSFCHWVVGICSYVCAVLPCTRSTVAVHVAATHIYCWRLG